MTSGKDLSRRNVLGLMAVGTVAGCGLDTDATVAPGLPVELPPGEPLLRTPTGPQSGATAEEIIRGFIHAGATSGEGLEVTRSFLTEACARAWIPDTQTVVYTGTPTVAVVDEDERSYRVSVRVTARIDADGRYHVAPPYDGARFDMHLDRVDGEWRIDGLQNGFGRLLEEPEVGYIFGNEPYAVHYPAIGWNTLVADPRWFPQDQLATRLVRAQLGGVPEHLEEAVSSDTGAQLAVDAVPVRSGVAQVDLDKDSVSSDATVRKQLAAQLVATLVARREISEVVITLSGNAMDVGVEEPLTTPEQFGFADRIQTSSPTVLARRGTKIVSAGGDRLASMTTRDVWRSRSRFEPIPESWRLLGLRPDGKEIAAVDGQRREMARYRDDGSVITIPPFAASMTRPCYDYGGVLWIGGAGLGREAGNRLWATNATVDPEDLTEGAPKAVPCPWLDDRYVIAAVVSPEGSRIAVISEERRGTGSTLEVSGVVRRANGLPTKTSPHAFRIGADLVEMIDAVWVGESRLAVLGRRDKETQMQPYLVDVGGPVSAMTTRPGMSMVMTTGDHEDVVLTSPGQRVVQRAGGRWQELKALSGVVTAGR